MAVIYPHFLKFILDVHDKLDNQLPYPFFDPACVRYEALRAVLVDDVAVQTAVDKYGLTEYAHRKALATFHQYGTAGLVGIDSSQVMEDMDVEVERMVFVLKQARSWIPATKMVVILKGFNHDISLTLMRHLYASYGWALGTKPYKNVDFLSLNRKVMNLKKLQTLRITRQSFFHKDDQLQVLLEVMRTLDERGITKRYPGSRVSLLQHKKNFLCFGLLGLVDQARSPFRNSKLGFKEEGLIVLSKIQSPKKNVAHYLKILESKKIQVGPTCVTNIFTRWDVDNFQSYFKGDLDRLLQPEADSDFALEPWETIPKATAARLDMGYIRFVENLCDSATPLARPGIFLFLPYLDRLKIFEKVASFMDVDPDKGYSWFSLLLLSLGRILGDISSISKACRINELSLPLMAGLVAMPSNDSLLNGLAQISDANLLQLRRHLTHASSQQQLIEGKRIAFDFKMRDFTGDDVELKNIGKGPSPKRKLCCPGFRPHLAWDVATGVPISLEFRNGKARATTTVKRFVQELLSQTLGNQAVEHVYLDSEYTAEHVWHFIVDSKDGLGADLTMCIKKNKKVKKHIDSFLETNPTWLFYDEEHTYTEQTFEIPIQQTKKTLQCVLKRKEDNGALRCFGSTLQGLDSKGILAEYSARWEIEIGIKDLVGNYYFDNVPSIDPHRINIHYFVVTLAKTVYEMFSRDYEAARNADNTKKSIGTLRNEFVIGTTAALSRSKDCLIVKWTDNYPTYPHQVLENIMHKLNGYVRQGLPFLGGLKLKFEIVPARPAKLYNKLQRQTVGF